MSNSVKITRSKNNIETMIDEIPEEEKQKTLRNCGLCSHQKVCSAFMLFKTNIEPSLLDESTGLKAENLAWICKIYEQKRIE